MVKLGVSLAFFILTWLDFSHATCYRKPQGASEDRSPVDENYQIQIEGNPSSYIPGQQYNISLYCGNGFKFISFTLVVEPDSNDSLLTLPGAGSENVLGRFEIIDHAETRFSTVCENMIESSNTNAKNRTNIAWVAPSGPQSGCVLFKAAIMQNRNVWFIDDGFLTKRLCPEEIDEINRQTPQVDPCCACDEAKYEIILERKWKRNTHAKDFPSESWRTKMGDIIGASHSLDYRFWKYGGPASRGLQELAEHGATKTLENEIMNHAQTGSIRTIIKAPGIRYQPNVNGKSLATVRVAPKHHVISLVLKIDPSPDWILGVSGLELCLANCTWIEKKILNLYPWDVGTDAGPSYMSADQAQYPADVVRRITSTYPSDYRSPFFDRTGAPMKPLATLHVYKKRTYERECYIEESDAMECHTHPWSSWTECSAKCGQGTQYRTRFYKDAKVAESFNCKEVLRQNQNCVGTQCGIQHHELSTAECEPTDWTPWSECSKSCGKGLQTRTRDYKNPYAKDKCQSALSIDLKQSQQCEGENCGGNIFTSIYENNNNDMIEEEEDENNRFIKYPKINKNSFHKGKQGTDWLNRETEEEQRNYEESNNNYDNSDFRPLEPNDNDEFVNNKKIYGKQKLVGDKPRQRYEQDEIKSTKLFGNLEPNFSDNDSKKQPIYTNPNNMRDPYGFRGTQFEDREQQQGENFCYEKPMASSNRCYKKRVIVKNYWFYDADDGECKIFTADNCDENKNKFLSMEKCLETCSQSNMQDNQDIMHMNRERYNSRDYETTQLPQFRSRWN